MDNSTSNIDDVLDRIKQVNKQLATNDFVKRPFCFLNVYFRMSVRRQHRDADEDDDNDDKAPNDDDDDDEKDNDDDDDKEQAVDDEALAGKPSKTAIFGECF